MRALTGALTDVETRYHNTPGLDCVTPHMAATRAATPTTRIWRQGAGGALLLATSAALPISCTPTDTQERDAQARPGIESSNVAPEKTEQQEESLSAPPCSSTHIQTPK